MRKQKHNEYKIIIQDNIKDKIYNNKCSNDSNTSKIQVKRMWEKMSFYILNTTREDNKHFKHNKSDILNTTRVTNILYRRDINIFKILKYTT